MIHKSSSPFRKKCTFFGSFFNINFILSDIITESCRPKFSFNWRMTGPSAESAPVLQLSGALQTSSHLGPLYSLHLGPLHSLHLGPSIWVWVWVWDLLAPCTRTAPASCTPTLGPLPTAHLTHHIGGKLKIKQNKNVKYEHECDHDKYL